jgi:hypothetical protein
LQKLSLPPARFLLALQRIEDCVPIARGAASVYTPPSIEWAKRRSKPWEMGA